MAKNMESTSRCCVYGCTRKYRGPVWFHPFPEDLFLRLRWVEVCGRVMWTPSSSSVICSRHFTGNPSVLPKNAVPTILLPGQMYLHTRQVADEADSRLRMNPNMWFINEILKYPAIYSDDPQYKSQYQKSVEQLSLTMRVDTLKQDLKRAKYWYWCRWLPAVGRHVGQGSVCLDRLLKSGPPYLQEVEATLQWLPGLMKKYFMIAEPELLYELAEGVPRGRASQLARKYRTKEHHIIQVWAGVWGVLRVKMSQLAVCGDCPGGGWLRLAAPERDALHAALLAHPHSHAIVYSETAVGRPCRELVQLVHKYRLEEDCSKEELEKRWVAAYRAYMQTGLESTLVILQRRWCSLKRDARRAVLLRSRISTAGVHALHWEIVAKYPHIVTRPLADWRQLVNEGRVVCLTDEQMEIIEKSIVMEPEAKELKDKENNLDQITQNEVNFKCKNDMTPPKQDAVSDTLRELESLDPTKAEVTIIFESDDEDDLHIDEDKAPRPPGDDEDIDVGSNSKVEEKTAPLPDDIGSGVNVDIFSDVPICSEASIRTDCRESVPAKPFASARLIFEDFAFESEEDVKSYRSKDLVEMTMDPQLELLALRDIFEPKDTEVVGDVDSMMAACRPISVKLVKTPLRIFRICKKYPFLMSMYSVIEKELIALKTKPVTLAHIRDKAETAESITLERLQELIEEERNTRWMRGECCFIDSLCRATDALRAVRDDVSPLCDYAIHEAVHGAVCACCCAWRLARAARAAPRAHTLAALARTTAALHRLARTQIRVKSECGEKCTQEEIVETSEILSPPASPSPDPDANMAYNEWLKQKNSCKKYFSIDFINVLNRNPSERRADDHIAAKDDNATHRSSLKRVGDEIVGNDCKKSKAKDDDHQVLGDETVDNHVESMSDGKHLGTDEKVAPSVIVNNRSSAGTNTDPLSNATSNQTSPHLVNNVRKVVIIPKPKEPTAPVKSVQTNTLATKTNEILMKYLKNIKVTSNIKEPFPHSSKSQETSVGSSSNSESSPHNNNIIYLHSSKNQNSDVITPKCTPKKGKVVLKKKPDADKHDYRVNINALKKLLASQNPETQSSTANVRQVETSKVSNGVPHTHRNVDKSTMTPEPKNVNQTIRGTSDKNIKTTKFVTPLTLDSGVSPTKIQMSKTNSIQLIESSTSVDSNKTYTFKPLLKLVKPPPDTVKPIKLTLKNIPKISTPRTANSLTQTSTSPVTVNSSNNNQTNPNKKVINSNKKPIICKTVANSKRKIKRNIANSNGNSIMCNNVASSNGNSVICNTAAKPNRNSVICNTAAKPNGNSVICNTAAKPNGNLVLCKNVANSNGNLNLCKNVPNSNGNLNLCKNVPNSNGNLNLCKNVANSNGKLNLCKNVSNSNGNSNLCINVASSSGNSIVCNKAQDPMSSNNSNGNKNSVSSPSNAAPKAVVTPLSLIANLLQKPNTNIILLHSNTPAAEINPKFLVNAVNASVNPPHPVPAPTANVVRSTSVDSKIPDVVDLTNEIV